MQYVLRNACRADGADVVKKITVAQVNESLDRLALAANDNHQQVGASTCSKASGSWC